MLKNREMLTEVSIPCGNQELTGFLHIPQDAEGLVLFVHGSGSSRLSKRNQYVAETLSQQRLATLLFDLLTPDEEVIDQYTREWRFNIELLSNRLSQVTEWVEGQTNFSKFGYFGASTGAAAALISAAKNPKIAAVVSRGGRPDLAGFHLEDVQAPTLLIVGSLDEDVITLNEHAMQQLSCPHELVIVPGASHLFEEPGTLEQVAKLAQQWFTKYLLEN